MARIKIDYGIDLGTTNSAICRMEKGVPTIKKVEVTDDTMPSCVYFNKKQSVIVGRRAYNSMKSDKKRATKTWKESDTNTYIEFKRTMGSDTQYESTNMNKIYSSEDLSSKVLSALKSYITDEEINSIVITVPAKFTVNQNTATMKAAEMAGFSHCELLQEPIAASMAYGLTSEQKDGYWMVFDFGGGTFDAALLKVEDGIMQVFDTEGDNYLGGKDLDYAITDEIIIPAVQEDFVVDEILDNPIKKKILRDAMKTYAEDAKNQLSFNKKVDILSELGELGEDDEGEELTVDITITQDEAFNVMRPYFQKAVDCCKELLRRNNLKGSQLGKLILVGGPTNSPLIRQMLKEQITENVDFSIDPMTAVATGAALYASTIDIVDGGDIKQNSSDEIRLKINYESTSVNECEYVSVCLDKDAMGASCPEKVWVEFVRSDKSWKSGKTEVDVMGNVIETNLIQNRPNNFDILVYDERGNRLTCSPNEFTIIQGTKVGAAPLPYHIGIAVYSDEREKMVFEPLIGMEKNKPFPAVGVTKESKKTMSQLRPGIVTDTMIIPVYQADSYQENTLASLYEHVSDIEITGEEVECLIPEGSLVDVTLKADSSQMMTMEVYFQTQDITIIKALDTTKKQGEQEAIDLIGQGLKEAQRSINRLSSSTIDMSDIQSQLNMVKKENENSSEKKAVLQHLKEVLRKIDTIELSTEWDRVEKDLRTEFERLEKANKDLGDEHTTDIVNQLRSDVDKAIRSKDVNIGKQVLETVRGLFVHLTRLYFVMGSIQYWNEHFNEIEWKDNGRARMLINQGLSKIKDNPTIEELLPIGRAIFEQLVNQGSDNSGIGNALHG